MTRQQQRARFRVAAAAALKQLLPGCPRHIRRIGARAYANQCFRDLRAVRKPWWHRYVRIVLNGNVRNWVLVQGK